MLALALCSSILGLGGIILFAGFARADSGAILAGNHPVEADSFRQVGEADSRMPLELQIRFGLRRQTALAELLEEQQNPASVNYHKWLTTDEFLRRFGPSHAQIASVENWLTNEGFAITRREGNAIAFSGAVALAQRTFAVRIAKFGDGSVYANTTDPIIPPRFAGVIGAVLGMDNMAHVTAMNQQSGTLTAMPDAIVNGTQAFGPTDLRTFYDESVGPGRDGTGSCIAIVDLSDFVDSTATNFDSQFGLPAVSYTRVLSGANPGLNGAEAESELDVQWAHVAAPGASINFYLGSNLVSDITAAVNANACGAISISYGFCGVSSSFMTGTLDPIFQQAAAQGQSVFVSAGDQGAAGLGLNANGTECIVNATRSVNEMSADPNVTSVGGTQFTPTYSGGNDQGYATETVWGDGSGATGGGVSQIFSKPAYQKGSGVPNDGMRDVPDIALIASPNSPGVFFSDYANGGAHVVCCIGGTSLAAPVWAGFASVIGEMSGNSRLGNFNRIIYPLANTQYNTAGFHDLTIGNNKYNGVIGFNAGPGFDQASGWGTIDFNVFAGAVKTFLAPSASPTPSPSRTATPTPTASKTATPTATGTRTVMPTATRTATPTIAPTRTALPTPTRTTVSTATATSKPTAAPSASPTPFIVTFPTTPVGSSTQIKLSIGNGGGATLSVNVGALAAPFAVYAPGAYNIAPGWTLTLTLTFNPTQTGSASQQLQMATNAPGFPLLRFLVSGVAVSQNGPSRSARSDTGALRPRLSDGGARKVKNVGAAPYPILRVAR
jgi:subtilase family serine protease